MVDTLSNPERKQTTYTPPCQKEEGIGGALGGETQYGPRGCHVRIFICREAPSTWCVPKAGSFFAGMLLCMVLMMLEIFYDCTVNSSKLF